MIKRRDTWKQDQPNQQLAALCQSVMGDLSNLKEGIIPSERIPIVLDRMAKTLDQIQDLHHWMGKSWENPPSKNHAEDLLLRYAKNLIDRK